jgi:hypothetical protein
VLPSKTKYIPFMCSAQVTSRIWAHMQQKVLYRQMLCSTCILPCCQIEILAKERYVVARAISGLTGQQSLKALGKEYWDSATSQLFSNLADAMTAEYLRKIGLKLTCTWSGRRVMTMCLETVDGQKWLGSTVTLREVYPLQPLNSQEDELLRVMSELVRTGPAVEMAPRTITENSSSLGVVQPSSPFPLPPSNQLAPEIMSVVVPANYPSCGHVITIASPTTGRIAEVTIPPGSLPGGQFLVQFN